MGVNRVAGTAERDHHRAARRRQQDRGDAQRRHEGDDAEHRIELKQIKGEVETIRTTVTSHVAKEDVLFQIFQKTLGLGIAIGGTLLATLLAVIGWLLTHQNPWINP
jgi:hypothetical protein